MARSPAHNGHRGGVKAVDEDDDAETATNGRVPKAYDDPDLPPMEFLLAVMHEPRTPLSARIDAAKAVSVYMHPRLAQVTQDVTTGVRIVIEGGLPPLPGTNVIMPAVTQNRPASSKPPVDTEND